MQKNWIKHLPNVSGILKLKSESIDNRLGEIRALQRQISDLEVDIKYILQEGEELAKKHWTTEEIDAAKRKADETK